jgi:hypothetical protein
MKTIEYYFIHEYQWKINWFSKTGLLKVKVYPTDEFIRKFKYVDFDVVGQIFTSKMDYIESIIAEIKKVISLERTTFVISNEDVSLEIQSENARPFDNYELHGSYETGVESRNWNITTPIELQYIPTEEILQLFIDWLEFLKVNEKMCFVPKTYLKDDFLDI